jgi:hypothetical protein
MTVHFFYRSPYAGPTRLYHRSFPAPSVLAWFREHWHYLAHGDGRPVPGEGERMVIPWRSPERSATSARLHQVLGCDVYGLETLFESIALRHLPPPADYPTLADLLQSNLYAEEGEIRAHPHRISVRTNDDNLELAYFWCDDTFVRMAGSQLAYPRLDGWQLPVGADPSRPCLEFPTRLLRARGRGQGSAYLIFLADTDEAYLTDLLPPYEIPGLRLPDLARFLVRIKPGPAWPPELRLLRSQLLSPDETTGSEERDLVLGLLENPGDKVRWGVYGDWLYEQGLSSPGRVLLERALKACSRLPLLVLADWLAWAEAEDNLTGFREEVAGWAARLREPSHDPTLSLFSVADHVAQGCLHDASANGFDFYQQWIIFDDLWVGANPELARSLVHFASTWDLLSLPNG